MLGFILEGEIVMKRMSQEKLITIVKQSRKTRALTQEELSEETGINRQMIGRLVKGKYMPSIAQLENCPKYLVSILQICM